MEYGNNPLPRRNRPYDNMHPNRGGARLQGPNMVPPEGDLVVALRNEIRILREEVATLRARLDLQEGRIQHLYTAAYMPRQVRGNPPSQHPDARRLY